MISSLKKLNEKTDIENAVDTDAVIRYFVAHNFVCNFDSYTGSIIHNYYLYEKDGQLSMLPWDYNLAFGGFLSGSDSTIIVNYPIDTPVLGDSIDSKPMLAWIFNSEEYTELYHKYFSEFIESYFDSGDFVSELDAVKSIISPYVENDPTKFCTFEEYENGTEALKQFCLLRAESVKGQLDGTIPSTSDGQNADKTSLIDASDISVFDMGAMHGGNNSRGMVKTNNFNREDSSSENTNPFGEEERHFDETPPDIPEDIQSGNDMPQMPIRGENRTISNDNNSGFDSFSIQEESSAMDKNETIRLQPTNTVKKTSVRVIATAVISAVVLACSIAFALLYKRKGY